MGRPKATLPYAGGTFLSAIVDRLTSLKLAWVGVVLPVDLSDVEVGQAHRLINLHPEQGQLSSLRLGLERGAAAFPWLLVALVDQPAVALSTYQALLRAVGTQPAHMWVPSYQGRRGHPVIFSQEMYADLLSAPEDQGARWAVGRHRNQRVEIAVDDPEVVLDIDTPEDLRRLEKI